jgi:hypothetical protein
LGRYEEAIERLAEARELLEGAGDDRLLGWAVFYDAVAGWGLRPLSETAEKFTSALALHQVSEDAGGQLFSSLLAALAMSSDGRHDESRIYGDPVVSAALKTNVPTLRAHGLDASAFFDALRDEVHGESFERATEALEMFRASNNYACVTHALASASSLLARVGDEEAAGIGIGISEAIRDRLNMVVAPYEDRGGEVAAIIAEEQGLDVGDGGPGRDGWDAARSKGRTMEPDEGIDWTISRLELAATSADPIS